MIKPPLKPGVYGCVTVTGRAALSANLALVLFFGGLAGCFGTGNPALDDGGTIPSDPLGPAYRAIRDLLEDVPCETASVSLTETSRNFRLLASDALDDVGPVRTHGELDFFGPWAVEGYYNHEGFSLVNLTDPLEPEEVSFVRLNTGSATYDVKFSDDGQHVYVGLKDRIVTVDVRDPYDPVVRHTLRHPPNYGGQAHMLGVVALSGTEYVFAVPSISGTGVLVAKRVGANETAALEVVTVYASTAPSPYLPQALAPHDVYTTWDPVENQTLLYAANGFNGWVVMSIDDPENPKTLATVAAPQGTPPQSLAPTYYHSINAKWIGDRRIVATSAEVGYNTIKVFDATDFSNIELLGQWVYDANNPTNMEHNLQIVNGTLFAAHYGQGVFVFDLRDFAAGDAATLAPTAHFQPEEGGLIWDVVVRNGVVFVSDIPQGLHVLGYGCFEAGTEALTSDS